MSKFKHIGRIFEYEVGSHGEKRLAKCFRIEFDEFLRKPVFIGVSPFGNIVRLSRDEVRFLDA